VTESQKEHPIANWQTGETVTGFALLARREKRQDRNANDYLDLELVDATGRIIGKVWGDSQAIQGDYEAGDFVAFKGLVKNFRDRLQLTVLKCRKATDADRKLGFDEGNLVPTTPRDIDELWGRLEQIYRGGELPTPAYAKLAALALDLHGAALKEHPAAKTIHHAYRGGLLEHVVSMAELALVIGSHYSELDRELLLLGVLFHDLGKLLEIGAMPTNSYTHNGRLVGHIVIGRDLLRDLWDEVPELSEETKLHLEHLILSHQGRREYGVPVEPMTAEALTLHMIDNLDSKLAQLRDLSGSASGFQYVRGLGRHMLLAGSDEGGGAKEAGDGPEQLKL